MRKPSLIIEGPDGVGKTTLASCISSITGLPVFKCPSEKQIFRDGGRQSLVFDHTLTHFLEQTGHRFVSDRGYPSEWVYSRIFKRDTDPVLLNMIDEAHGRLGTVMLYLYSSVQPVEPDDIVPSDKYFDILRQYDLFMDTTQCPVARYDTAQSLHLTGKARMEHDTAICMGMLKELGF
jgi:hypothetical protein